MDVCNSAGGTMEKPMNLCRFRAYNRIMYILMLILLVTAGLIALSVSVCFLVHIIQTAPTGKLLFGMLFAMLLSAFMSIFLLRFSWACSQMESRRYCIEARGIWIANRKKEFFPWEQISEIACMKFAASASGQSYQTVICFFLAEPTCDSIRKLETSYYYGAKNYRKNILIDYSPEVCNRLGAYYPGEIKDYRKTGGS